ncbi:TPA: hypothetical protein ACX6S8_003698 [Photobacterium damselae]
MKAKVFILNKNDINDATSIYIDNIVTSLVKNNYETSIVDKISLLSDAKLIITLDAKATTYVKFLFPFKKVITWYQGVVPEEAKLIFNSNIRYLYWSFFEFFSLRFSSLNIFVSNAMILHYEKKYKIKVSKKFVMPCFNKFSNMKFKKNDKSELSFVYAGSAHKWQCVEQMLLIYKYIKLHEPRSSLSIFSADIKNIKSLLLKHDINGVTVKYVPIEKLDYELKKFEYGFIIREDNIVNNVATPTKLNTYYSLNIKPIVSNCIHDFRTFLNDNNSILLDTSDTLENMAKSVIKRSSNYNFDEFFSESEKVFRNYYNIEKYNKDLTTIISGV